MRRLLCVSFIFWRVRISRILVPSSTQSSSGAQMQNATQKDVNNHVDRFSHSTTQRSFDTQIRPFAQMHCGECYSRESCYRILRMIMSMRSAFCVREELFSNHMMVRRTSNYLQWQMCRCGAKRNVIDLTWKLYSHYTAHLQHSSVVSLISQLYAHKVLQTRRAFGRSTDSSIGTADSAASTGLLAVDVDMSNSDTSW